MQKLPYPVGKELKSNIPSFNLIVLSLFFPIQYFQWWTSLPGLNQYLIEEKVSCSEDNVVPTLVLPTLLYKK